MSEQPLDLRSSLTGLWRRRFFVGALGVIGLCGGVAYAKLEPPLQAANALVIVQSGTTGGGAPDMDLPTEILIATSDPVLSAAGQAVSPPLTAAQLRSRLAVTALSADIIQVEAKAPNVAQAIVLANAVSSDYMKYFANTVLKNEPADLSAPGTVRLLQAGTVVPASKLYDALAGAVGLVAGLFVGCVLALARWRGDRRLRLRDEVSSAVGLPVLASLEAERRKSTSDWRKLLERYQPSPAESWSVRRVLHHLLAARGQRKSLEICVVAFANDDNALAAGAQFAKAARVTGLPVAFAPDAHPSLVGLRAACAVNGGPALPDRPFIFPADGATPDVQGILITVSLVVVEPGKPVVSARGDCALLAVSSGAVTSESLAMLALAASDAGQPIEGILMVNPDPADSTTGSVVADADWRGLLLDTSPRATSSVKGNQR
jgi:capsular polysaccharide biosynthesis protein